MTASTLMDLRRLYQHLINEGKWDHPSDTRRIAEAIRTIEELRDGACRHNCATGKAEFKRGIEWAIGFLPDNWEEAWKIKSTTDEQSQQD